MTVSHVLLHSRQTPMATAEKARDDVIKCTDQGAVLKSLGAGPIDLLPDVFRLAARTLAARSLLP